MRILDVGEEVDNISNLMIDEPEHADFLLAAYEYLIEPIFSPLKASKNISLSEIQQYDLNSLASKMPSSSSQQNPDLRSFPVEIGRFIMQKIALNPSSYHACIEVIQHYEQNQLYKVLEALDRAIKEKKQDEVTKHISELNEIMNNFWKDADKVKHFSERVRYGISVAIGGVGIFAPPLMGGEPSMAGLLASFGFLAGEKALSKVEMSIVHKLTLLFNNQYLVNIYDFKQKHNLK